MSNKEVLGAKCEMRIKLSPNVALVSYFYNAEALEVFCSCFVNCKTPNNENVHSSDVIVAIYSIEYSLLHLKFLIK